MKRKHLTAVVWFLLLSTIFYGVYKYYHKDTYYIAERVEFVVEGKWGQGYSGKHSAGERLYFRLYSEKYNKVIQKTVHPLTYQDYDKGDKVVFEENHYDMVEGKSWSMKTYIFVMVCLWTVLFIIMFVPLLCEGDVYYLIRKFIKG